MRNTILFLLLGLSVTARAQSVLSDVPFKLDDQKSKFKFQKITGDSVVYAAADAKVFAICHERPPHKSPGEMSQFYGKEREEPGVTILGPRSSNLDIVNGYQSSEWVFNAKMNGKTCLSYEMIVVYKTHVVYLFSYVLTDFDATILEIEALTHTIKVKP